LPDKPILIFPAATVAARATLPLAFTTRAPRPNKYHQEQRLAARFQALTATFGTVQAAPAGVDPEQVIVLETVGSVADFQNVVRRIPGLEWLGDFDVDVEAPDPGFLADGADPMPEKGRLFVLASSRSAYNEVLRLWNVWLASQDDKLPRNFGGLAEAFRYLNDVRAWSPQDRVLATGIVAYWEKGLASNEPTIRFEAELWCRAAAVGRAAAFSRVQSIVNGSGGQCVKQAAIAEIDYHGVLIELPAEQVRATVDAINAGGDTQLLRLTEVKYFAPVCEATINPISDGTAISPPDRPLPTDDPVVALLDGLPLTNHAALQGRLVVDDPDGVAATYAIGEHRHGTAMASLIAHGEYDGNEPALTSKIYVRPVMAPGRPDVNNRRLETFPSDELAVDLIHRAVRRMFDSDGTGPAASPGVKVINLSLGDSCQVFDRHLSPWARLLDWLAFKYQVLFVVASGNPGSEVVIPAPPASIASMSDDDLRSHALRSMGQQRLQRRLFAPAESINALTVGALHAQAGPVGNTGRLIDPLRGAVLPSPASTVASGFRRAVKPEILVPGGRLHLEQAITQPVFGSTRLSTTGGMAQPGQLVAACDPSGTSNQHATRIVGSSNAAALTTRRGAQMIDRLRELQAEPGGELLTDAAFGVILKAMLVHGASWEDRYALFDAVFAGPDSGIERWWRIKRACTQFFGYGPVDFDRGTLCTDQRVIVLGCGALRAEQGHIYNVPLPPALNAQTVKRRLTVTLAWLTPTNPRHRSYRVADLWFDPPTTHLRVKRTEVDHDAVCRGTVQHEVLEGTNAVPITDGDTMPVQVNCRPEAASTLDVAIPYALLVTLETAQPHSESIYTQVKTRINALRAPVPVAVSTTT
jgi:hypothetical protein